MPTPQSPVFLMLNLPLIIRYTARGCRIPRNCPTWLFESRQERLCGGLCVSVWKSFLKRPELDFGLSAGLNRCTYWCDFRSKVFACATEGKSCKRLKGIVAGGAIVLDRRRRGAQSE